jgi:hypothetical protein
MAVDHCLDVLDWTERQGATRMEKLRETGLKGIPGHFQRVVGYPEMYNIDDGIHSATMALYVAILAALEEVLVFYTKSSGSKLSLSSIESICSSVKSNYPLDAAKHSKVLVQVDQCCPDGREHSADPKLRR